MSLGQLGVSIDKASQHSEGRLSGGAHRAVSGIRVSLMLSGSPGGCSHGHSMPTVEHISVLWMR